MSGTVAIKNVDDEDWQDFKAEAAKHGMAMGDFFSVLVEEHKIREAESNWDEILSFAGSITEDEAEELREKAGEIRHGFEMREHGATS